MKHAEKKLKEINCSNIWLNARIKANEFYLKLGYTKIGPIFEVPLIGKHQCFFKKLTHEVLKYLTLNPIV
ncbi:hypothetical protein N9W60_03535 [Flavobacteriaceae bacterium]|nr:hypothetical protein [Flavobacteriaceae bacterium]